MLRPSGRLGARASAASAARVGVETREEPFGGSRGGLLMVVGSPRCGSASGGVERHGSLWLHALPSADLVDGARLRSRRLVLPRVERGAARRYPLLGAREASCRRWRCRSTPRADAVAGGVCSPAAPSARGAVKGWPIAGRLSRRAPTGCGRSPAPSRPGPLHRRPLQRVNAVALEGRGGGWGSAPATRLCRSPARCTTSAGRHPESPHQTTRSRRRGR